jgi:hypothetical protein
MRAGRARRWMVGLTLGALAWMGAASAASAHEELPPPGKVRISLLSPDERALQFHIVEGPEGTAPASVCRLPCKADLPPGTYRVRFSEGGLKRSWPRSLSITSDGTYHVSYHSRAVWRALGGILTVVSLVAGSVLMGMSATTSSFFAGFGLRIAGASILGVGLPIGLPLMFMPDKARVVPVQ